MGMFDTVHAKCPRCLSENSEQIKHGQCIMLNYYVEDGKAVDRDTAYFVEKTTVFCDICKKEYLVDIEYLPIVKFKLL
jgi:hypothetical protein